MPAPSGSARDRQEVFYQVAPTPGDSGGLSVPGATVSGNGGELAL
ncbi:hypothetical protein AB4305_18440 [Nocardia sp. 2YAB30]